MRRSLALAVTLILAAACVGQTRPPEATPTPVAVASPTPSPTPSPSPSPTPRVVPPFERVVPVRLGRDDHHLAPDRERVAFVGEAGALSLAGSDGGAPAVIHRPAQGWMIRLGPRGLRGNVVVFEEVRGDGMRVDTRVLRVDLAAGGARVRVLDEFTGPFLGVTDTWLPSPPVTNGRDVLWTRVDLEAAPFLVSAVVARPDGAPVVVASGSSATWVDLAEDGRALVAVLIGPDGGAELSVWREGQRRSLGTRKSADGGPAMFLGDRIFWARGAGIAAPIDTGGLIEPDGRVRTLDLGCPWLGATRQHLQLACAGAAATLLDVVSGERFAVGAGEAPAVGHHSAVHASIQAVVWREGTQWWIGILAP